jgi:hypothetical protein
MVTNLRHEVFEPIGLGRSLHFERSRWGEQVRGNSGRPLTRDISVGSASQGAQPPAKAAQCFWATRSAARGVRSVRRLWSRVVSVAEIDKRRVALALAGEEPADTPGV